MAPRIKETSLAFPRNRAERRKQDHDKRKRGSGYTTNPEKRK